VARTNVERTETALDDLLDELAAGPGGSGPPGPGPDADGARAAWRAMVTSRALDVVARRLKGDGRGYYTISSAGHEYNALVALRLRTTDPAFLHYRAGAFVAARRRDDAEAFVRDTVVSFQASVTDPVSAGRHKVWGSREAWIPPQTSTIASHVPKATGTAIALGRVGSGRLAGTALTDEVGADAVVCATFGDASLNHATTASGLTMARWARRHGAPVPILFVCEDNGLGISVPTPRGWVEGSLSGLPGLTYVRADGDPGRRWEAIGEAVRRVRDERAPVALHLPTVRLWGHAGSDVEVGYRDAADIAAAEAADPLLETARWIVATGRASGAELRADLAEVRARVERACDDPVEHATTPEQVLGPLVLHLPDAGPEPDDDTHRARAAAWERAGAGLPEHAQPPVRRTLGARLNAALHDLLDTHPEAVAFGEDVATKGGVYGITAGLRARYGQHRVFDTMLDETAILGAAQGFGLLGHLPVPEIQYLAYLHNALDQLRGEACSTTWLSDGAFATPMVVRVASFAYQKGFGGHFHNDDAIGALRDIPGLLLAAPARGDDAVRMLRGAAAMASQQRRVVAFLEPIALYHERDLYDEGDGGWLTDYPVDGRLLPGTVAVYAAGPNEVRSSEVDGARLPAAPDPVEVPDEDRWVEDGDRADVLVVTYANGVRMALRAARRLLDAEGIRLRVMDLRWLQPLPMAAIASHARDVGRVLVVDECRATGGGIADAVIAGLVEGGSGAALASIRARDSYVPLGPAASQVLVTEDGVVDAARALSRQDGRR
jgi:2-oxoisovalerate dehydrogenase E1 component